MIERARRALSLAMLALLALLVTFPYPAPAKEKRAQKILPKVVLPSVGLQPRHIGVVVNKLDPESVRIGKYYVQARGLPKENLIQVGFSERGRKMDSATFTKLRKRLVQKTPPHVEAYLLTWDMPYVVDCMSMASAVSFGFDTAYCAKGCKLTKVSPYFNSKARLPYTELGFRPTMVLPLTFPKAKQLIDKSITGDGSWPDGTAYLVETSNKPRNVRKVQYPVAIKAFSSHLHIENLKTDALMNKPDVLFYFTGIANLRGLESNTYLPGAVADNLTSGSCAPSPRTKEQALRPRHHTDCRDFLEAGATGSYGTAIEPCNFLSKFSNTGILMHRYLYGETLLESHWKSVQMPGQGIFTGDPLAKPFGGYRIRKRGYEFVITTRSLHPGWYDIWARTADGKTYMAYEATMVSGYPQHLRVPDVGAAANATEFIIQPANTPQP